LEAEVGGSLFVRGGRSLRLTEQGESFLPYARRSLDILNEGVEAVRQTQSGERGRVTLATFSSLAATVISPLPGSECACL
jgi:DNA-binding transcriptional LysR family regulator